MPPQRSLGHYWKLIIMRKNINLLYYWNAEGYKSWQKIFSEKAPEIKVFNKDNCIEVDIDVALVWLPPEGFLKKFQNLKGVINLGQGVDHLLKPGVVPDKLPIIRLVDEDMSKQMAGWVSLQILRETCFLNDYLEQQKNKIWKTVNFIPGNNWTIGILGIGAIGSHVAKSLTNFGYKIKGWSKNKKNIQNVECYSGREELHKMLKDCNILVCLLPLTSETKHIICTETLSLLPKGSTIINAGRGGHVNETDLLEMINKGHIKNAYLDVFETEPLPKDHSFWEHKNVYVWPHVSAQTNTLTSIDQIVNAARCITDGLEAPNQINRSNGY